MTDGLPPDLDFDTLRAAAIAAAQDASGKIWTDYNLHDPGVTLLEQTLFGLTEVAYMGDHGVRDLLTGPDSAFDPARLAIFAPEDVLQGRPVTRADLASFLSDLDDVDRVFVRNGPAKGLVDLTVIPRESLDPDVRTARAQTGWRDGLIATLRQSFAQNRLLTQDINRIEIATPSPVALHGTLDISPVAEPERIVAEVIHQVQLLLRGLPADLADGAGVKGATRADVFDDVMQLRPALAADISDANRFDGVLAALRRITGLERVTDFTLRDPVTGAPVDHRTHGTAVYHEPILPKPGAQMTLTVTREGSVVPLDAHAIREELGRIEAARITRRGNRKNDADWDVLRPGRHRATDRAPLDATLPAPYRRAVTTGKRRKATDPSLARYRAMMDQHLDTMVAPLADLDHSYSLATDTDLTDPAAVRHRVAVLDYLISLQGETMPVADPSFLHLYRGVKDRLAWQVRWRETYLAALPWFHHYSGTAHPQFGFAAQLAHLADLAVGTVEDLNPDPDQTLRIDDTLPLPDSRVASSTLILPSRPTDVFITRSDDGPVISLQKLAMSCPWIVDKTTTPAMLQRAASADAYLLARNSDSDWEVLFQPGDGGDLIPCGSNRDRARAEDWANRLRLSFAKINQTAEHLWVIEDVHLRQNSIDYAPASAIVVLPGWTARTARPGYRLYVADLIARLAPAHLYIRPLWLDWPDMDRLRPLLAAWQSGKAGTGIALRSALRDLAKGAAA